MIRSHLRRPGRPLLAALLAVAAGCGVPSQGVNAGGAPAVTVLSQATGALPGFADEAGDALLVDAAGGLARVRLDGTLGPLESHPRNAQAPGKVLGVHPLGPHLALVAAQNGLYLAQGGWLIAAPWSSQLAPEGVRDATDAGDGSAWIAHESGLFRLKDGLLSELRIAGGPVQGLTAVQASRAEDGVPGVWFAHSGGLSVVVPTDAGLRVRPASLEGAGTMKVRALAALGDSAAVPGEIWVLTEAGEVFRNARDGWRKLGVPGAEGLVAAGRVAWLTVAGRSSAGQPVLRYDADADRWNTLEGLPEGTQRQLLAADASGAAWVTLSGEGLTSATYGVQLERAPRVRGLDQNMRISDGELVVRAYFPPGAAPTKVVYTFDDATGGVEARAPLFSLGGDEGDGRPRPYSFVGLSAGAHRLSVKVTYADDSTAQRVVPYVFQPLSQEVPGWERDILPIHQTRCAKCHETGPGIPLNTYALWRDNAASIVDVLRDRRMPADGPLEPDLILKVQRWVQGGAQP